MKMCQPHWDKLKQAIIARGLGDFIASSGNEACERIKDQLQSQKVDEKNFDPLMAAYMAIWGNSLSFCQDCGLDFAPLLFDREGEPETCPICYLNHCSAEHDRTCTDPNCKKQKGCTFEHWIERAVDDQREFALKLGKV